MKAAVVTEGMMPASVECAHKRLETDKPRVIALMKGGTYTHVPSVAALSSMRDRIVRLWVDPPKKTPEPVDASWSPISAELAEQLLGFTPRPKIMAQLDGVNTQVRSKSMLAAMVGLCDISELWLVPAKTTQGTQEMMNAETYRTNTTTGEYKQATFDADALAHRIAKNLRFYDIAALGRLVNDGKPLGIDFNRAFTADKGPTKEQFAKWLTEQSWWSNGKAMQHLPDLEREAAQYYASKGKRKQPQAEQPEEAPGPADVTGIEAAELLRKARVQAADMDAKHVAELARQIHDLKQQIEATKRIHITHEADPTVSVELGRQHAQFMTLLKLCKTKGRNGRLNVWMTGPAGSGKTTAAMNAAKALNLPFYFCGAINDEYKLLGFTDAQGRTVRTPFREAFEHGGVFLMDEVDGSAPAAILALNAALANGTCDFPEGNVKRHSDCIIIAAANTWGSGATHKYVGRNKLDAATLDRYVMLAWDYDTDMELQLSGNPEWARTVQRIRANILNAGIEAVISPRATYTGADLLAAGMDKAQVVDMVLRRGMPSEQWQQVARGVL